MAVNTNNKKNRISLVIGFLVIFFLGLAIGWIFKPTNNGPTKYSAKNVQVSNWLNSDHSYEADLFSEKGIEEIQKIFNLKVPTIKNNTEFKQSNFSLESLGYNDLEKYKLFVLSQIWNLFGEHCFSMLYGERDSELLSKTSDVFDFEWYIYDQTNININFTYHVRDNTKNKLNISTIKIEQQFFDLYIYDDVIFQEDSDVHLFTKNLCQYMFVNFHLISYSNETKIKDDFTTYTGENYANFRNPKFPQKFTNFYWLGSRVNVVNDQINIKSDNIDDIFEVNKENISSDFDANIYNNHVITSFDNICNRYLKFKDNNKYNPHWLIQFGFDGLEISNFKDSWTNDIKPTDDISYFSVQNDSNQLDKDKFIETYEQWKDQIDNFTYAPYDNSITINFNNSSLTIDSITYTSCYVNFRNVSLFNANFDNLVLDQNQLIDVWTGNF